MPRYFFHKCDGETINKDREGRELGSEEVARNVAIMIARCLISEDAIRGHVSLDSSIRVEAEGEHLFTLPFREAVTLTA